VANPILHEPSEGANSFLQTSSQEEYSILQDPPAEANCILQSCLPFIPQEDDSAKEQVVCPIEVNAVCPIVVPINGALENMKPIEAEKKLECTGDEQYLILGLANILENLLPEEKADLADVKAPFIQDPFTKMEVDPFTNRKAQSPDYNSSWIEWARNDNSEVDLDDTASVELKELFKETEDATLSEKESSIKSEVIKKDCLTKLNDSTSLLQVSKAQSDSCFKIKEACTNIDLNKPKDSKCKIA